jgi:hypothetical protein
MDGEAIDVLELDEGREGELHELVQRLERLLPREGAHLTVPADAAGHTMLGNRMGYLRFGLAFLSAGIQPLPASGDLPARIEPDLDRLLTPGSTGPFDVCEVDEAIVSRAPVEARVGVLGQFAAGVLVVAALIAFGIVAAIAVRFIFGF